jgi:type IV pilus assembly protein PilA
MLQTLRARRERGEDGFTLIELMVVVLIIAILMYIAIPTFLGARSNAGARAVQSTLRNALSAEKVYFTANNGVYTSSTPTTNLVAVEPAIRWLAAAETYLGANLSTPNTVIATTSELTNGGSAATSAVLLVAKASNGDCYYILDDTLTGTNDAVGTSYMWDDNCADALVSPVPLSGTTALVAKASTLTDVWAKSF